MKEMINNLPPLVSIIIPAYNSEDTLDACIQSALGQTYQNIEVIVVNDGSTDRSDLIIGNYIKTDIRVVGISKSNEGLPMARKSGIDIARGKYIQHLDSDDTLNVDAIENLVNKAEKTNADIVVASYMICYPDCPENNHQSYFYDFGELSGFDYFREMLKGKTYWCVWACFQRRSLFLDHSIETVPQISYGEDAILMTQLLMYAQKVVSMNKTIICYNRLPTSMSHLQSLNDRKYMEFRAFPVWMENYITKRGLYQSFEEEFALLRINNFFVGISFRRLEWINEDIKRIMNDLKQFPNLKRALYGRQRKILTAYQFGYCFGKYYLMRCIKKRKI